MSANAVNTQEVRLRPLPVGGQPVKIVAKDMCAQIVQMLQTAGLNKEAPERLIMLWINMSKKIRAAGLAEAEVKAAVAQVTGAELCVKLCIDESNDDLNAWAGRLSDKYLNTSKTATLSSRLYMAKREASETALTFLTREAPLARAIAATGVLPEHTILAALWRIETLGLSYCQLNSRTLSPLSPRWRRARSLPLTAC